MNRKLRRHQTKVGKVGKLIHPGFLTRHGKLGSLHVVWKTLNASERAFAEDVCHGDVGREEAAICALSIYIIDSTNVICSRGSVFPVLLDYFMKMPGLARYKLINRLTNWNFRTNGLLGMVEGFSYTPQSHILWRGMAKLPPNDPRITGIPGTDAIGLSDFQLNWVGLMRLDDLKQTDRMIRNTGKLVAATMSPKGIKDLDKREEQADKREEQRREELVTGVKTTEEGYIMDVATETVDLQEQWENEQAGISDPHDVAVRDHENRMIEWAEEKQRQDLEYKQEIADRNRSFLGPDISGNETFVALTPEEMVAYMENLKERRKQKSITSGQQPVDPAAIIKAMKHRKS